MQGFSLDLSTSEWAIHSLIFAINIGLFLSARPLLKIIHAGPEQVQIFRALNVLVFFLHSIDLLLMGANINYQNHLIKLGYTLMTLYIGLFLFMLSAYFARKRFGHEKEVDNKTLYLDTYSSRLVNIILLIVIAMVTVYAVIKIWGADSLLETTGIFGIIFAFLAFTSNNWAPDLISGLVILNAQALEDGDVVRINDFADEYIINKVSFIYSILYDVRNNHRTLIRNSQIMHSKIDNLSKIASTDGVRQALTYNIGYPALNNIPKPERTEALARFKKSVDSMFSKAFTAACDADSVKINPNKDFEWAMTSAGDDALEYTLWFYLERIPNTKVTATVRKHLMGTNYKLNEMIYDASIDEGIDLSTPRLLDINCNTAAPLNP